MVSDKFLDERIGSPEGQTEMWIYVLTRYLGVASAESMAAVEEFRRDASYWHNIAAPTRRELFETCERVFIEPFRRHQMSHVFEGEPDSRQSDERISVSRFRPRFRALSDEEKEVHDAIKAKAEELEALFERVAAGHYHSLALISLEESIMWIIKELTGEGGLAE